MHKSLREGVPGRADYQVDLLILLWNQVKALEKTTQPLILLIYKRINIMEFEPISRKRTSEAVIENIEARILDGTFVDGKKLPSEEQLAAQ